MKLHKKELRSLYRRIRDNTKKKEDKDRWTRTLSRMTRGDENVSSDYKDWSASCIAQFLIDVWPSKYKVDKLVGSKYGMYV